jgi:hypothetical protein
MNTYCRNRLQLLGLASLLGSGSRKAPGAVSWFSETTHVAFYGNEIEELKAQAKRQKPATLTPSLGSLEI